MKDWIIAIVVTIVGIGGFCVLAFAVNVWAMN
jgi:uncharacterized membrane protein